MLSALAFAAVSHAAAAPAACSGDGGVRLTVQVAGLRSADGLVAITVYPDDEARFLASGGKLARQRVPATQPVTEACFTLPAAGYYAIAVYHDENGNHSFDRTLLGAPKEGYGFSNNPGDATDKVPSLAETRFSVKAGANTTRIELRYP